LIPFFNSSVTTDAKFSAFDPFVKVTKVAEDGIPERPTRAEHDPSSSSAAAGGSHDSSAADKPRKFVRRTRVLKNGGLQPVWREEFFVGALEYDDLLRLELKTKSKDQGQKTQPNPTVCSVVFRCGDVLDALGRLGPEQGARVKFQLVGDKATAVLTCVATFDSDVPLVLSALLPPATAATLDGGATHSSNNGCGLAPPSGASLLGAHCYVSLNHNHAAMLLASEALVRKAQHD
jgi:hypothetical protein